MTPLPPADGGVVAWAELVTGEQLYPWQRDVLVDLACTTQPRPRVAYIQVPRKSGKTRLAAILALSEVCLGQRRHVYCVSDSERNLNSVLIRELRDLIGASEYLRDSLHIYKDKIEVPETGSFIETRANNFKASQGVNPHLVLFDEVHLQKNDQQWSGFQMAGAARPDALLFGITTPGYQLASLAHDLYTSVKAGDPTLYGRIYEGDPALSIDDRNGWRQANPCYDRPGFAEAMAFDRSRLPEHEFRRFRLGMWTATESAWFPAGAWDLCASTTAPEPPEGTRCWVGFDGSFSGDSTALVGVSETGHVWVIGYWGHDTRARDYRVPRDQVEARVREAMTRWDVQELICDPPYWQSEIHQWSQLWPGRVLEFPTWSRMRMAPACSGFYSAVMERKLTHDGDPRLAAHIAHCVVKPTPAGDVITKEDRDSPNKIDLAVAAVIAHSRAILATPGRSPLVIMHG